ncbi:hypothetical protein XH98_10640 [Bradyrhizobium sp. CCBAU 51745]|uniref:DUF3240 family protein n=1 Tax=Bradyrhizobium sp. CCBAU 51745 TaxID=1325099 RepID=UPI0023052255|nr:DUF3240 family protein [Bradyrhizobium sp. CCBAU 51745]MDA9439574.1 hypothetical protein [Bradyrhizobium sp. CCBAU 51745]
MTSEIVCLSLILARKLGDELLDFLSEQSDLVAGFTVSDAAGHGAGVQLLTAADRVKGHADQVDVRIILRGVDAKCLVDRLRTALAGSNLVYWIVPVEQFGTIA